MGKTRRHRAYWTVLIFLTISILLIGCSEPELSHGEKLQKAQDVLNSSAASQEAAHATPVPDLSQTRPQHTPIPIVYTQRISDEDLAAMYAPIRESISDHSYQRLKDIYNLFGIQIRMDGNMVFAGDTDFEPLEPKFYDQAIESTYTVLYYLTQNDEGMRNLIDQSVDIVCPAHRCTGDGYAGARAMIIDYRAADYSDDGLYPIYIANFLQLMLDTYPLDMQSFADSNGFLYYADQLSAQQLGSEQDWLAKYKETAFADESARMVYFIGQGGLLTEASYASVRADWIEYQRGLWLGHKNFWREFSRYDRVRDKAIAQIKQYERINPMLTLEFFSNLSNFMDYDAMEFYPDGY